MLWAIMLGAVTGVAAVLFAPYDAIYRAMGTCFLLAGCALLMMLVGRLVDRERTRASGLLGMGLVIASFFIALALIWDLDRVMSGAIGISRWRTFEALWMTIGWLTLTGIPGMLVLRLIQTEHSRPAGWLGLILAAVTFIILMTGTTLYAFGVGGGANQERWFLTGMWIGLMGALAVGCLSGLPRLIDRPWVWLGVVAAAAAATMGILGAWTGLATRFGENLTVCLISAAIVVCYANVLLLIPLRPQHKWLTYAAIAIAILTAIVVDLYVIYTPRWDYTPPARSAAFQEFLERAMVAGVMLSATGMLAMAVLARLHRPYAVERSAEQIHEVTITCPVCRTKQQLPTDEFAACRSCGLRIDIRIAEPHCPHCDYLLYYLRSPNCPECGHDLSKS